MSALLSKLRYRPREQVFKYLWMKYVDEVDLRRHCLECLIGVKSKKIRSQMLQGVKEETVWSGIDLDESASQLIYICGVTDPYVWRNNLHAAMRLDPEAVTEVEQAGIYLLVEGAELLEIREAAVDPEFPRWQELSYRTCRNLQFAWDAAGGRYGVQIPSRKSDGVIPMGKSGSGVHSRVLDAMRSDDMVLLMDYKDSQGTVTRRHVKPSHFVGKGIWRAWCFGRQAQRTFLTARCLDAHVVPRSEAVGPD